MNCLPDALRELIAAVLRSLPRDEQISALSDSELTEGVAELTRMRNALDTGAARLYAEVARRSARELGHAGLAAGAGYNDPAKFLQAQTGSSYAEARRLVASGELLAVAEQASPGARDGESPAPPLPIEERLAALALLPGRWDACIGVALRDGLLGHDQARALRTGLKQPVDDTGTAAWRRAALELTRDGVELRLDADELLRSARRRHAVLDREEVARLAISRFERRRAERFAQADGMVLWKLLADPESDARLRAAVDAITAPRRGVRFVDAEAQERAAELDRDPRTLEQLQFDAVFGILACGIDADPGRICDPAPVVRILVTREELHAAGIAHLEGHDGPLPYAAVARSICDSGYVPIAFDSSGQPLDLGRRVRTFTAKQREALAARDGGCRAPGCTRPPAQCEAHHLLEWAAGGCTDLDNGILLCRFHHLNLHNSGGRITREVDSGAGDGADRADSTAGSDSSDSSDDDPGGGAPRESRRAMQQFWMHRPGTPPRLLPTKSAALEMLQRR